MSCFAKLSVSALTVALPVDSISSMGVLRARQGVPRRVQEPEGDAVETVRSVLSSARPDPRRVRPNNTVL